MKKLQSAKKKQAPKKPRVYRGYHVEFKDDSGETKIGLFNASSAVQGRYLKFASAIDEETGEFIYSRRLLSNVRILRNKPKDSGPDEPLAHKQERMRRRYLKCLQPDPIAEIIKVAPPALKVEREIDIKGFKFWRPKKKKVTRLRIKPRPLKKGWTRLHIQRRPKVHKPYNVVPFVLPEVNKYKSPAEEQGKLANQEPQPERKALPVKELLKLKLSVLREIAFSYGLITERESRVVGQRSKKSKRELAQAINLRQRSIFTPDFSKKVASN